MSGVVQYEGFQCRNFCGQGLGGGGGGGYIISSQGNSSNKSMFFLSHSGNIGVAEFNLSEKCIKLCKSAKSVLAEMCDSLESGDITLKKLSYVNENKDDLKKLLHEAMPDRMKKLEQLLKERLQEQAFFTQRLHYLQRLCQTISIEVTGKHCTFASKG